MTMPFPKPVPIPDMGSLIAAVRYQYIEVGRLNYNYENFDSRKAIIKQAKRHLQQAMDNVKLAEEYLNDLKNASPDGEQ